MCVCRGREVEVRLHLTCFAFSLRRCSTSLWLSLLSGSSSIGTRGAASEDFQQVKNASQERFFFTADSPIRTRISPVVFLHPASYTLRPTPAGPHLWPLSNLNPTPLKPTILRPTYIEYTGGTSPRAFPPAGVVLPLAPP
jgi:hypothetical protein